MEPCTATLTSDELWSMSTEVESLVESLTHEPERDIEGKPFYLTVEDEEPGLSPMCYLSDAMSNALADSINAGTAKGLVRHTRGGFALDTGALKLHHDERFRVLTDLFRELYIWYVSRTSPEPAPSLAMDEGEFCTREEL
jgi:hypothetical protein